jgi:Domain of unknown function (DUF4335)
MTIRRQYSLPNCTLILDGLSDGTPTTGSTDPNPVMSSLFNAECHFDGCEQPLFGGRDFLTSLVSTVNSYTQELLSGVPHPSPAANGKSLVSLARGDRSDRHTLNATPDPNSNEGGFTGLLTDGQPTKIELSTVQLFDLVEAIDRFLADKRTLPDLKVPLKPVTKALVPSTNVQATSIGLGLTSLIVASIIGYALPTPKVSAPKFFDPTAAKVAPKDAPTTPKPTASPATTSDSKPAANASDAKATPQASSSPSPTPLSALEAKTGKIVDGTQLGFLDRKLRRDLNRDWQDRSQVKQTGTYRVSMNQDGEIIEYQPIEGTTDKKIADLTPLPKLVKQKNDPGAIGDFKVVFTPEGVLQVSPWDGHKKGSTLGKEIVEPALTKTLGTQLQSQLEQQSASEKLTPKQDIEYQVGVTKTGDIVDYQPTNSSAYDAESKTPLPKLVKFSPEAAGSQEPVARYLVTFKRDGKVAVVSKRSE